MNNFKKLKTEFQNKKLIFSFVLVFLITLGGFITLTHAGTIEDFIASLANKELGLHVEDNAGVEGELYVGGNLGVGTTEPTDKLTVDGIIKTNGGIRFPDGSLQLQAVKTTAGLISEFAGTNVPNGWLLCNGSEISRTTYSNLFNSVGEMYGAGDGSTTFNLPLIENSTSILSGNVVGIDFNGSDEFMKSSDNSFIGISNIFTIQSWIYLSNIPTERKIIYVLRNDIATSKNIIRISYTSERKLEVLLIDDNANEMKFYKTSETIAINQLTDFTISWDGLNLKLYIDGVEDLNPLKIVDNSGNMNEYERSVYVGSSLVGSFFNGGIVRIDIWNTALPVDAISTLYANGNGATFDVTRPVGNYTQINNNQHQWRLGNNLNDIGEDTGNGIPINLGNNAQNISEDDIVNFSDSIETVSYKIISY